MENQIDTSNENVSYLNDLLANAMTLQTNSFNYNKKQTALYNNQTSIFNTWQSTHKNSNVFNPTLVKQYGLSKLTTAPMLPTQYNMVKLKDSFNTLLSKATDYDLYAKQNPAAMQNSSYFLNQFKNESTSTNGSYFASLQDKLNTKYGAGFTKVDKGIVSSTDFAQQKLFQLDIEKYTSLRNTYNNKTKKTDTDKKYIKDYEALINTTADNLFASYDNSFKGAANIKKNQEDFKQTTIGLLKDYQKSTLDTGKKLMDMSKNIKDPVINKAEDTNSPVDIKGLTFKRLQKKARALSFDDTRPL